MSQLSQKIVRPGLAGSLKSPAATSKSAAQFEAARRARIAQEPAHGAVVMSLKDSAPGALLIGFAIAEAIFVEPIRSLRRKLRGKSAA